MSIEIRIEHEDAEEIRKSLDVDNVDLPNGMTINMVTEGENILVINLKMEVSRPKDLLTLKSTADEIMRHVEALVKTMERLNI
ncbi:KEOPS complex subunit Pcc1 [Sulfuracidifex metallicus]|uniref:KEOPS complex Pcc1-like subunit n=1 Tax=Sulfuracidifex metallicus DSM 6482 = JCM 9184 TaxID=523847 RepID=A0A6A9QKV4_SULME|nr:KEOPS complex subunit Pcc1 [Sulfuracidifex metallicus]MUN28338.1 hypothetical protein [Sulfuracidifex metallicus DSM 6482 = JCM 9184]WOE51136.1 KEOPS complex subunit Pcc1 [Sulfuracidifex metallicus DSM 6482 = JCM 9184]